MNRVVPPKELRSAAATLETSMLEELAKEEMIGHEFSSDFQRKMEAVLVRARHRNKSVKRYGQQRLPSLSSFFLPFPGLPQMRRRGQAFRDR